MIADQGIRIRLQKRDVGEVLARLIEIDVGHIGAKVADPRDRLFVTGPKRIQWGVKLERKSGHLAYQDDRRVLGGEGIGERLGGLVGDILRLGRDQVAHLLIDPVGVVHARDARPLLLAVEVAVGR